MDLILRVLKLEVSVYNVYITNQFQTTFAEGIKSVSRGDCEEVTRRKTPKLLRLLYPITSKNSASVFMY
jgi:hypothetical protein